MKRQELTHLHAFLIQARLYLEQEEEVSSGAWHAYDAQPIRPKHVHRGKDAHEEAVFLLLQGFDRAFSAQSPDPVTAT